MFYEAMEEVLPDVKVVIQSKDGDVDTVLPLDSFISEDKTEKNAADDSADDEN